MTLSAPPTRGSAGWTAKRAHGDTIRPAHAGISRRGTKMPRSIDDPPRPRGDQPSFTRSCTSAIASAPPTRGSAGICKATNARFRIRPAHAGISRCASFTEQRLTYPPRPRGDQPWTWTFPASVGTSAPPTRGSADVYATYAAFRFNPPRPRGDQPKQCLRLEKALRSAPPTRGSARTSVLHRTPVATRPAHAGISQDQCFASNAGSDPPRPRGDQPVARLRPSDRRSPAPPTRGSAAVHHLRSNA